MAQLEGGKVYAHPQWSLGRDLLSEGTRLAAGLGEHPTPQGTIMPVCSATGMDFEGSNRPRSTYSHLTKASKPITSPVLILTWG